MLEDLGRASTSEARAAAAALVETAVQRACAEIYRMASADPSKRGMGTTFVCLVLAGTKGIIGHVGDSRVYLLRDGQCHRLTEDHTLIAAQLKAGTITREQAQTSQYRNVITRAVGIQESVQVDTLIVDLLPGDLFLLCSDGLHGYLADEELPPVVADVPLAELPATSRRAGQRARRQGQHHRGGRRDRRRRGAARGAGGDQQPDGGAEEDPALPPPHLQGADGGSLHRHDAELSRRRGDRHRRGSPATSCSSW